MDKLKNFLKDKYGLLALVLMSIYTVVQILQSIGGFGGRFNEVLATIISLLVAIILYGSFIVALILKKDKVVKFVGSLYLVYFCYTALLGFAVHMEMWNGNYATITILYHIFAFILYAAVAVGFIFYLLSLFLEKFKSFKAIVFFIGLGVVGLSVLMTILGIVRSAVLGSGWISYFQEIGEYLVFIPFLFITYLKFYDEEGKSNPQIELKDAD